jgi:diacylglycerol kinase (ATP)
MALVKAVAIVNPVAGNRKAGRLWPKFLENLGPRSDSLTTWWTQGPGHGEILAAKARRQGFERVLAVGGDGTIFEVVNGLWWEPRGQLPSLGLVPLGTGCDYVKNFSRGRRPMDCLVQALEDLTVPVHVGVLQVQAVTGEFLTRVFLNVVGLGFDARVVERRGRQQLPLGGIVPYVISAFQELLVLRSHHLSGRLDGQPFTAQSSLLVAGLGRYFGASMMITPLASPESGRFHVVWEDGLGRLTLLALAGKTFRGTHLSHHRVHSCLAQTMEVSADPPALVEVEGELVGRTPLKACISPEYLHVAAPLVTGRT